MYAILQVYRLVVGKHGTYQPNMDDTENISSQLDAFTAYLLSVALCWVDFSNETE